MSVPQQPLPSPDSTVIGERVSEQAGALIGPYKLMEQIGEGGFGLVFVAEQQKPVRRRVALKVVKPGMDTRDVIARFDAERQALALMDHPNIARVLDAGATDSGRPYFVMELVHGIPITDYCNQNQLTPRERLELFVSVCQAVQHAHQKGIIHRDIKPSNVLVTSHDGRPMVKVIDFGVAKALHQPLTDKTIYTRFAQMIGTPLYMSPEQAEMSGSDVDTRSDIYSLGVLLYELLTGTTPFDKKRLAQIAYDELIRIFREEEPPKPSTRLSRSTDSLPAIAAQRKTEPARLSKMFRGDLDWITMKALEKDRTRRYETANGLARDVERYLTDEPVEACPPSTGYRLKKLARRHRAALATVSAFAAVLIAAVIVSTWLAIEANRAKREALRAQADEQQQRTLAEAERNRAIEAERKATANAATAGRNLVEANRQREVADRNFREAKRAVDQYLTHVAEDPELSNDPDLAPLRNKLLDSALTFYQSFAAARTDDSTLLAEQAAAHLRMSRIKHTQGKEWVPEFEKGLVILTPLVEKRATLEQLAPISRGLFTNRDQTSFKISRDEPAALRAFQRAANMWSTLRERFPDAPGFQNDLAGINQVLALLESRARRFLSAASAASRAQKLLEGLIARYPDDPDYRASLGVHLMNLAGTMSSLGRKDQSLEAARRAVALLAKVDAEFPGRFYYQRHLHVSQQALGVLLYNAGNYEESAIIFRQAVTGIEELTSKYPRDMECRCRVPSCYSGLTESLAHNGKNEQAIIPARKAIEQISILRRIAGPKTESAGNLGFAAAWGAQALSTVALWDDSVLSANCCLESLQDLQVTPRITNQRDRALVALALAQHFTGKTEQYHSTCAKLTTAAKSETDLSTLNYIAYSTTLRADAVSDYGDLLHSIETPVKKSATRGSRTSHEWNLLLWSGVVLYRAGQYERSLERLTEFAESEVKVPGETFPAPYSRYFRAMAHYRLGHLAEARTWLDQASNWDPATWYAEDSTAPPSKRKRQVFLVPQSRAALATYRREAEELIQGSKKPNAIESARTDFDTPKRPADKK
jgi:serine/threonine protein kinase/tetratricopeptide (TPR) repeat protein